MPADILQRKKLINKLSRLWLLDILWTLSAILYNEDETFSSNFFFVLAYLNGFKKEFKPNWKMNQTKSKSAIWKYEQRDSDQHIAFKNFLFYCGFKTGNHYISFKHATNQGYNDDCVAS